MKGTKFKPNHNVIKGILLVFVLLCSLGVSAQTTFTIGNLEYTTTSDSTVSVGKNGTPIGELVIPTNVEYEGTQYSVTSIGNDAFAYCSGLTSIDIPNSVTSIGISAFVYCSGLTSIDIPNSVTSIGISAFFSCTGLTSVTIPNSVKSIGFGLFEGCSNLIKINVNENNTNYSSIDGVLFNKSQTELIQYPGGKQGSYAIPNSVTSIGRSAFWECHGLTSVTIPNSVTNIGYGVFYNCTRLTSVTIPNSVTSIGNVAFGRCSGLTSIDIPSSVTSIGNDAFAYCSGLTSIDIPNSVTSIGDRAFRRCSGLTSITIPNSVTSIGAGAFSGCSGLTSVTIPNSVTSIGSEAFSGCTGLTSVTIGNSVTSIGWAAFSDCSGLTDIYCHIEEPLTIDSGVFNYVPTNTCTLHVPIGSKVKYQAADVWKSFLNIVEDLPTGIVSIDNSQLMIDNDVWHTLNGVRLNGKPTKTGVYIVNGRAVVIK